MKAERDEDQQPHEGLLIQRGFRGALGDGFAQRKWNRHPCEKEEERKDAVIEGGTEPRGMRELFRLSIHPRPAGFAIQLMDHRTRAGSHEHVETAQGVDGDQTGGRGRSWRGNVGG